MLDIRTSTPLVPLLCLVAFSVIAGTGCSQSKPRTSQPGQTGSAAPAASGPANPRKNAEKAPLAATGAAVDGLSASLETLETFALEAAGAVALEEVALDLLLDREMTAIGLTLAPTSRQDERERLFERISQDAQLPAEQAGILIDRFRASRGLGPARFEALLLRTAKLRSLVRNAGLDAAEIARLTAQELAPRAVARIALLTREAQAQTLRLAVLAAPAEQRSAVFTALAAQESTDPSASRGGLFGPVSHTDISVPEVIRTRLVDPPGTLSPVLAAPNGFAVVFIESQLSPPHTSTSRAASLATTRTEREAIDRLAAQLLAEARITILNDALRWSWGNRAR